MDLEVFLPWLMCQLLLMRLWPFYIPSQSINIHIYIYIFVFLNVWLCLGFFSSLYHIKKYGPLVNHMSFGFSQPHCSPNHDLCLPTLDQYVVGDVFLGSTHPPVTNTNSICICLVGERCKPSPLLLGWGNLRESLQTEARYGYSVVSRPSVVWF